jgi:hypothetical protein
MGCDREDLSVELTIKAHHKLPPGVDTSLFDHFFHKPEFLAWVEANRTWQLHISGAPGCGKVRVAWYGDNTLFLERLTGSHQDRSVVPYRDAFEATHSLRCGDHLHPTSSFL